MRRAEAVLSVAELAGLFLIVTGVILLWRMDPGSGDRADVLESESPVVRVGIALEGHKETLVAWEGDRRFVRDLELLLRRGAVREEVRALPREPRLGLLVVHEDGFLSRLYRVNGDVEGNSAVQVGYRGVWQGAGIGWAWQHMEEVLEARGKSVPAVSWDRPPDAWFPAGETDSED